MRVKMIIALTVLCCILYSSCYACELFEDMVSSITIVLTSWIMFYQWRRKERGYSSNFWWLNFFLLLICWKLNPNRVEGGRGWKLEKKQFSLLRLRKGWDKMCLPIPRLWCQCILHSNFCVNSRSYWFFCRMKCWYKRYTVLNGMLYRLHTARWCTFFCAKFNDLLNFTGSKCMLHPWKHFQTQRN